MALGKRPDPRREAWWRRTLARQAGSGLSVRAFCRREGLHESAWYAWRRVIHKRDAEQQTQHDTPGPAFVAVRVGADQRPDDDERIALELRGGRVLRLPISMPPTRLAALLHAIEEAA